MNAYQTSGTSPSSILARVALVVLLCSGMATATDKHQVANVENGTVVEVGTKQLVRGNLATGNVHDIPVYAIPMVGIWSSPLVSTSEKKVQLYMEENYLHVEAEGKMHTYSIEGEKATSR